MEPDHGGESDAELLLLIRSGDTGALGRLYARHREAGLRVARAVTGDPHLAEDLVAGAFERIQATLARGHGPDDSFRAYLYTVIRRLAVEHGERRSREQDTEDWAPYEAATALADATDGSVEARLVSTAFGSLPERHQAALWYLDVEGLTPAQAAPLFGISANAVSALAVRARDALRDAYLQAHVGDSPRSAECAPTRRLLGAHARGSLSARDAAKVEAHLADCDECPVVLAELRDVAGGLRSVFGPILLGGVGAGLGAALAAGGWSAQSASAAGALGASGATGGGASGAAAPARSLGQGVAVGAVAVVAALAVTTIVSAVANGATAPPNTSIVATADPADDYPRLPSPTPAPSSPQPPQPAPVDTPAAPPPVVPAPVVTAPPAVPAAEIPPSAALDLDITDDGDAGAGDDSRLGTVAVDVLNTDDAPIAASLRLELPDGVAVDAGRAVQADALWACGPMAGPTIECTASGVPIGGELHLRVPVRIAFEAIGARPIANLRITRP